MEDYKNELSSFLKLTKDSYNVNHQMISKTMGDHSNREFVKWKLNNQKIHVDNLTEFTGKFERDSNYTTEKYHHESYLFFKDEIDRIRVESMKFMNDSQVEEYKNTIKIYDTNFERKINPILTIIKDPNNHIPTKSSGQGCIVLFILPPLLYILTLIS